MRPLSLITLLVAYALPQAQGEPAAVSPPAVEPGLYAVISTSMGQIKAKLLEQEAPQTVNTFVSLANGTQPWRDPNTGTMVTKPLYQNLTFHRVLPDYVIQTGDPAGTGTYDCGVSVQDEFSPSLTYDRPGRLGLMNAGAPNTGGCQFFITDDAYPSLDRSRRNHGYAIFGQVVDGQEIVNLISRAPRDTQGRPRPPVRLVSVTIQRVGPEPAEPVQRKSVAKKKYPKLD